ncbi:MAG: S8 family peptidase [Bacteroidia bacterium]|nr:S8 family peptidase [Bacteroidia bacterium]
MKKINSPGLIKLILSSLLFLVSFNLRAQQDNTEISNEFIVMLNSGTDIVPVLRNENLSSQVSVKQRISQSPNIWLLQSSGGNDDATLALLKRIPEIIIAQKNHIAELRVMPDDAQFGSQWSMNNTGQTGGSPDADIDAPEAWDITTGGLTSRGDSIVIAIIDCGFYLQHEDLNFWKNNLEIPGDNIDNDNNGYIDDYDGWNSQTTSGVITSCNHGTHVAGIAGAIGNNAIGVAGVNWNVKIMPIQPSSGNEALVVGAYSYAYTMRKIYNSSNGDSGAFVVSTNSSFGINFGQPANFPLWCAMYDSLGSVGILSAGAGPNLAIDVDVNGDIPTACASDWLISVTNTNSNDNLSGSACWGDTTIDLGAPGSSILSTYPNDAYQTISGTSMATPHVAGAVALMWAAACTGLVDLYAINPASVALVMKNILLQSVDTIPALLGQTVSNGRLNLYKCLLGVQNYCITLDAQSPDKPSAASFILFPNPASTNLELFFHDINKTRTVTLTDVFGRVALRNYSAGESRLRMEVSKLARGVYFLNVFSGNDFHSAKVVLE